MRVRLGLVRAHSRRRRFVPAFLLLVGAAEAAAAAAPAPDAEGFAAAWCARNRATSEPAVIYYNKIGKCGSTTMDALAHQYAGSKGDSATRRVVSLSPKQWKDGMRDNRGELERMKHIVRLGVENQGHVFVTGHVYYDPAFLGFGDGVDYGRFQLFRDCAGHSYSNLVYDIKNADAACLRNLTCVRRVYGAKLAFAARRALRFVGGENLTAAASIDHLLNNYTAWGFIDRLSDTLEVLACAFPSYFSPKIEKKGGAAHERLNACQGATCKPDPDVLAYVDAELCGAENELLVVARALFDAIHRRIAGGGAATCCRAPRNATVGT